MVRQSTMKRLREWSRTRKLAIWVLATVLPVTVLTLGLEGAGRLYMHLRHGVPGKSYGLWRYDDTLGAQHRENAYNSHTQTNDFGFRNREPVLQPKPVGTLRVIAYGGSTTFCYNLSDFETWPYQLELLLRESEPSQHQVLNAGAIMWSIGHAYARAKKDVPLLRPDHVIIYSGINEHANAAFLAADAMSMKALVQSGHFGAYATNLDQNRWLKRNLVTVRLLDYLIVPWLRRSSSIEAASADDREAPTRTDPFILENYLHVLGQFIDLNDSHGARTVFVIQAHDGHRARNEYLTGYSRAGAMLAKSRSATVVDATHAIVSYEGSPRDLFSSTGVHYSALGARRLAELLHQEVFALTAVDD